MKATEPISSPFKEITPVRDPDLPAHIFVTEKECRQLWDDILRTGSNNAISAHFVGSIVYIEKGCIRCRASRLCW